MDKSNNNKIYFFLLSIFCLVLFFVNIRNSHDWGDDFAQYIHQAKNIIEGISQKNTGYLFNDHFPLYAPPAFTIGFPLLLSPVYYFFGNNLLAFSYYVSFFMMMSVLFTYILLSRYMKPYYAFLISLALLYNPLLLNFKMEIVSEFPFTAFLLLCALFYHNKITHWRQIILPGLLAGFLISIRTVGATFIIAIFIHEVFLFFKSSDLSRKKKFFLSGVMLPLIAVAFYYLLNYLLFNLPHDAFKAPADIFTFTHIHDTILFNLNYYMDIWQDPLDTDLENKYVFISTLGKSILLGGVAWGFLIRIKNKFSFHEIFVLVYMLVLLVYPYAHSGFRFLIPVAPFLMLYLYESLKVICNKIEMRKTVFTSCIALSVILLYKYDWEKISNSQSFIPEGPQRPYAQEIFTFIMDTTKQKDRILFTKPRALSLYTGRESFVNNPEEELSFIEEQIVKFNLKYILTCKELPNAALNNYVEKNIHKLKVIKSNDVFTLYRL